MSTDCLKYYDLTHRWGHGMPQWPSSPGVNAYVKKFHAKDGVYEMEFEGIMHRGTHMDAPLHVTENTPHSPGIRSGASLVQVLQFPSQRESGVSLRQRN